MASAAVEPGAAVRETLLEQKVSAGFRAQNLTAVPSDLLTLRNVVHVDLTSNRLTRLPGRLVASELLRLEVLLLRDNLLFVFEDVLELAAAPRLRELDVAQNPLRLQQNRIYQLEALFHEPGCDDELLLMDFNDAELKHSGQDERDRASMMRYRPRLPRRRGFPMLLKLNGEWITDTEIHEVEAERGAPIEYFRPPRGFKASARQGRKSAKPRCRSAASGRSREHGRHFDGSRMTMKQMAASNARATAIPAPHEHQRFQIDVDTGGVVEDLDNDPGEVDTAVDETAAEPDEVAVLQQLFRPTHVVDNVVHPVEAADTLPAPSIPADDEVEPWNYPVSTFDGLNSEDRHYVRAKSKQTGETIERDDHFFASTPFVDCIVQCERSRRLTVRAVDLLSAPTRSNAAAKTRTQSHPTLPSSQSAAALVDTLNTGFSRQKDRECFEKVAEFERKGVVVNGARIKAAVSDFFLAEHLDRRASTSDLISDQRPRTARATAKSKTIGIEASLSKTKLQNAVDLANSLGDAKQQKYLIQALIDADEQVIEEERVEQEQAAHRRRLNLIQQGKFGVNTRRSSNHGLKTTTESPWQARNQTAKLYSNQTSESPPATAAAPSNEPSFRQIVTVDRAAQDPMAHVNSHDLLVRCADIRQHAGRHMKSLAVYRDRFLEDAAEWEHMRQDPTNVLRRHLHRRLHRDTPHIDLDGAQYFYSPLFQ